MNWANEKNKAKCEGITKKGNISSNLIVDAYNSEVQSQSVFDAHDQDGIHLALNWECIVCFLTITLRLQFLPETHLLKICSGLFGQKPERQSQSQTQYKTIQSINTWQSDSLGTKNGLYDDRSLSHCFAADAFNSHYKWVHSPQNQQNKLMTHRKPNEWRINTEFRVYDWRIVLKACYLPFFLLSRQRIRLCMRLNR